MNIVTQKCHTHCDHKSIESKKESKFDVIMNILEKVSAVALGIFSAYCNWQLFLPFFAVGLAIGVYTYIKNEKAGKHTHPGSSCAHGLIEQLTGVELPKPISLAANIAVTVCHIDHHSSVFIPIVGVSLGAWVGKAASHYGVIMHKKITPYLAKNRAVAAA